MSRDTWVFVETFRGQITETGFMALAAGRALADAWGGELTAYLIGAGTDPVVPHLGLADAAVVMDDPALAEFSPDTFLRAIVPVLRERKPDAALFAQTTMGMDLAAAVAHALDATPISSCQLIEDGPTCSCLLCGGKIVAGVPLPDGSSVITVMPGGYRVEDGQREGAPAVESLPVPDLGGARTSLVEYVEPDASDVDISREAVLISVGRGIQQEEHLETAQAVASMLGGSVSASRPVVDLGWLPTTRLVGKSGRRVSPRLYLALGISGAPEHLEGVGDPDWIVAINTDETAPIFEVAQHGATVDALELLPRLNARLAEALQLT